MKNQPASIKSLTELDAWLTKNQIDTEAWGQGATKTIANLWQEVQAGEVALFDNPPLRISQVVQVVIRQNGYILIEAEQHFRDKQRRSRNLPPSEKLKPGEDHIHGGRRCLIEELGVEAQAISNISSANQPHIREADSLSYPGLRSRYIIHTVEATVAGLPTTDFCTEEAASNSTDPINKHYWTWQLADTVKLVDS